MARNRPDPERPVAAWSEKDLLDHEIAETFVVIFRSPGCYWSKISGCLMCGYNNDCLESVTPRDLIRQFESALEKYEGQEYFKLYNSGSFFDPNEIGIDAQERILEMAGEMGKKVLVESRPEFVSQKTLDMALERVGKLEIAIGLETASDELRCGSINKGFKFRDFEMAAKLARDRGASVRTYLILKPPYITEQEAIDDLVESLKLAGPLSDVISINPMNIQNRTVVEGLWKKDLYRPPWLWSLLTLLRQAPELTDARIVSAPSGGGSKRGAHNCGKCDREILASIDEFSLRQDAAVIEGANCDCKERWKDWLELEEHMGTGNLERLARPE